MSQPRRTAAPPVRAPILLDSHAHFYDCFGGSRFLDHAAHNFGTAAAALGVAGRAPAHLVINSTARSLGLPALCDRVRRGGAGAWRIVPTAESISALATRRPSGEPELVLIAGVQAATIEGLEVLAIACAAPIADGMPLRDTIAAAHAAGAIAVIPWGFGKWWLRRAGVLRELLDNLPPGPVFLGDSANRPRGARTPLPLRLAGQRGLRVLPGTDPLPLRSAARGTGRYGCVIDALFDPARPAASLVRALADASARPRPFGARDPLHAFVRSQLALRLARTGTQEFAR